MTKKTCFWLIGILWVMMGRQPAFSQLPAPPEDTNSRLLGLMEQMLEKVHPALSTISPELNRIALYRLYVEGESLTPPLRDHFSHLLVESLRSLEKPRVVDLPEFNTLRITSTDTSFSIVNALPSPDELWRVGRRLRIDAFMVGKLTYLKGNALMLDLRLNRTGSNEVIWAESFTVYEKPPDKFPENPFLASFNVGVELFPVELDVPKSMLRDDFTGRISQYHLYFGFRQNFSGGSRFGYEFQMGLSFLSEGIAFDSTYFETDAFYGKHSDKPLFLPVSYDVRTVIFTRLIENQSNPGGDWLSLTLGMARYFAREMPDFNVLSLGLRSDLSRNFSLSAGFSYVFGNRFHSVPVAATGKPIRMRLSGISYQLFFLQYTF